MKKKILSILTILFLLIFTLIGCNESNEPIGPAQGEMAVHYIDVGQGDSILIQVNGKNLLIDGGPGTAKTTFSNYLKNLNLEKIDYVIATHPHEDHIGNLDDVINDYEIGAFYSPKVTHTTKAYENMIKALKNKNLKINVIKEGTNTIDLGEGTRITVFSPNEDEYDNLNNYSPIMKIEFGETSFLFTGDAEKEVEADVLALKGDISADVIKFGHHGSSTSTSEEFLKKVNPSIGVIQLGADNKYGHPHKETQSLIDKYKIKVFRNDKDGNIVLISDGKNITLKK